jgi:hypothetical protein
VLGASFVLPPLLKSIFGCELAREVFEEGCVREMELVFRISIDDEVSFWNVRTHAAPFP